MLKRFSQGYYAMGYHHDSLVFQDLRFGETEPWEQSHPQSAFYYFLQYPDANQAIIQRGRVKGWNSKKLAVFLRRIKGKANN